MFLKWMPTTLGMPAAPMASPAADRPPRPRDVLAVFAKAPVAGQVKTRLAAALGKDAALRIYRDLGRRVVAEAIEPRGFRTVVWFAPRHRGAVVRRWLANLDVEEFQAQRGAALGARLIAAFARHFEEGASRVAIVGTDCPGIRPRLVRRALRLLATNDVALGPACDGGYYLIALRAPAPALFTAIPWSTPMVLRRTLARAAEQRLSVALLPAMRDVDTASDARAHGLVPRC